MTTRTKSKLDIRWEQREDNLHTFLENFTQYDKNGGKFAARVKELHARPENIDSEILEGQLIRDLQKNQTHTSTIRLQYFCAVMTDHGIPGAGGPTINENFDKMSRVIKGALPKRQSATHSKPYDALVQDIYQKPEIADEKAIMDAGAYYNIHTYKNAKMELMCRQMVEQKKDVPQKEQGMAKMRAFLGEICPPVMSRSPRFRVNKDGRILPEH